jgi:hypothetical protein
VVVAYTGETWDTSTHPDPVRDGRPVQAHPTHVITTDKEFQLWIDQLRSAHSVQIDLTGAAASLQEVYEIADGIGWTG